MNSPAHDAPVAAAMAPAASTKAAPTKAAPTKAAPTKAGGKRAPARKTAPATPRSGTATPRDGNAESTADLTPAELADIRAELATGIVEMQGEYAQSLAELDELQAGTDGAGDDQADAGSNTFDREQELSIVANRLDLLSQMAHAVDRIDAGTYGFCEICGQPIPRVRLQAFPMATLDVACKQREERR